MKCDTFIDDLPGGDLIRAGLLDRAAGLDTVNACLVEIMASKLGKCGFEVEPSCDVSRLPEHRLYHLLHEQGNPEPYGQHHSLLRMMSSFGRALEGRMKDEG